MPFPESVRDSVLFVYALFKDISKPSWCLWWIRILEVCIVRNLCLIKPDDVNAFPVLRNAKILRCKNSCVYIISEIFQGLPDCFECSAVIMPLQIFYILKQKCLFSRIIRAMSKNNVPLVSSKSFFSPA